MDVLRTQRLFYLFTNVFITNVISLFSRAFSFCRKAFYFPMRWFILCQVFLYAESFFFPPRAFSFLIAHFKCASCKKLRAFCSLYVTFLIWVLCYFSYYFIPSRSFVFETFSPFLKEMPLALFVMSPVWTRPQNKASMGIASAYNIGVNNHQKASKQTLTASMDGK